MENTDTSGGTRFSAGKPGMWWAIPLKGLRLVAQVTMHGSKKYAPLDWACGQSYSTLIDSASRHWIEVLTDGPLSRDAESGLYHLAHCAWNILCLLHFMEQGREDLDDVSKWAGVTTAMKNDSYVETDPFEQDVPDAVDTTWIGREEEAGTVVQCDRPMMSNRPIFVSKSPGAERMRLADRVRE